MADSNFSIAPLFPQGNSVCLNDSPQQGINVEDKSKNRESRN